MAGIKIVDLPALGRDLASTDLLELSLAGGTGSRKITGQEIMNASKLSINNTPIINGTVGRVLFQGTGNVLQQSSSLFWDATNNRLGIGTSTPNNILQLKRDQNSATLLLIENTTSGSSSFAGMQMVSNTSNFAFNIFKTSPSYSPYKNINANDCGFYNFGSGNFSFLNDFASGNINFITGGASTAQLTLASTGNVLIGTTTDAGFRLDVNGTARVQSTLTLGGEIFGATNTYFTGPSLNTGTLWLRFNAVNSNGNFTATGPVQGTNVIASGTNSQLSSTGAGVQGVLISNTATSTNWRIEGHRTTSGALEFKNDLTNPVLNLFSTRNVGIGTFTDAGFRLDVNGTARVQTGLIVSATNPTAQIAGAVSFSSRISGNLNGAISGQNIASLLIDEAVYSGTGSNLINYAIYAGGRSYFDRLNVGIISSSYTSSNVINDTASASLRLIGYNVLTGGSGSGNGTLLLTDRTSGTMLGMTATYGGGGSRLTIFNQYSDGPTSRIKINLAGADTACFFGDGSLQIGNGETTIASAILSASSTTRGFLPPRMTQAQRNAIASPAIGLEIYQTDATEGKYIYKSSGWTYIG